MFQAARGASLQAPYTAGSDDHDGYGHPHSVRGSSPAERPTIIDAIRRAFGPELGHPVSGQAGELHCGIAAYRRAPSEHAIPLPAGTHTCR